MRIPDEYLDLFTGTAFGHLATVMADGSPQVTPVWVAVEERDGVQLVVRPSRVVAADFG